MSKGLFIVGKRARTAECPEEAAGAELTVKMDASN